MNQYQPQIDTLLKLHSYVSQSLANGQRLRTAMHAEIDAGIEPTGYRAEWLRTSVAELFRALEGIATRFNEEHPGDRASSGDLQDCLQSCIATLQSRE